MKTSKTKLKVIINATVQEIWNKSLAKLPESALPTLRLNMIVRKRCGTPEEAPTYDELIKFIDERSWLSETKT